MAISFSRPDHTSPAAVSSAQFPTARRGFDQNEVRDFMRMVAAELARLQERERHLERELRAAQQAKTAGEVGFDDETATRILGEEAARVLQTAREAASQIRARAEEGSARLLREATDEAQRMREEAEIEAARRRQDASSDAEAEVNMAKQQGRDMVNEARAYRERVLSELARRREMARQQIEQLIHGRDRLLQAFERARLAAVDVMAELTPLGEPTEFVNLSPTTGPVPLMVAMPRPEPEPEAVDEPQADDTQHAPRYAIASESAMYDVEAEADDDVVTAEVPAVADADVVDADVVDADVVDEADGAVAGDETSAGESMAAADGEPTVALHIVADETEHTVVSLPDPLPVDESTIDHDREPAPVVSLFAGEMADAGDNEPDAAGAPLPPPMPAANVDDLFAKLRAARSETVALQAAAELIGNGESSGADAGAIDVGAPPTTAAVDLPPPAAATAGTDHPDGDEPRPASIDELVVPIIVSAARKLKRVLADEQNEVLDTLRRKEPVRAIDALLPWEPEQGDRYAKAVEADLVAAAMAGARGGEDGRNPAIVRPASDAVVHEIVAPLRDRLTRCIDKAGGSNSELANQVRSLYREWKSQRIDEHVEDIVRLAYDRGALTVAPR